MSTLNTVSELKHRDIVVASPPQLELPSAAYVALTLSWRQLERGDLDIGVERAAIERKNLGAGNTALMNCN